MHGERSISPCQCQGKVLHRDINPDVMAFSAVVKGDSKQNMTSPKVMKETLQREKMEKNRVAVLVAYEVTRRVPRFFKHKNSKVGIRELMTYSNISVHCKKTRTHHFTLIEI